MMRTGDCCHGYTYHSGEINQCPIRGLPFERYVMASKQQKLYPHCTITFVQENDVYGGATAYCQTMLQMVNRCLGHADRSQNADPLI